MLAMTTIISCSKDIIDDETEGDVAAVSDRGETSSPKGQGILSVRTRGADDEVTDANVSFPLNICVFDENCTCV